MSEKLPKKHVDTNIRTYRIKTFAHNSQTILAEVEPEITVAKALNR